MTEDNTQPEVEEVPALCDNDPNADENVGDEVDGEDLSEVEDA